MTHIFISYSHNDDDFATELESRLEAKGIDAWTDHDLEVGDNWKEGIDAAIEQCFALLVVVSPQSKSSEYVTYEWSYALGAGIKVLPLLLKPTPLHPKLADLQYLDFTGDWEPIFAKLMRRLLRLEMNYLIDNLKHSRYDMRLQAVKRLGERKIKRAVPQLIHMLTHDRSRKIVRPAVAQALENIGTPEAMEAVETWRMSAN